MDNEKDRVDLYFTIIVVIFICSAAFYYLTGFDDMTIEKNNALETTTILIQNKITNKTSIHDKIEIIRFYCEISKLNTITCIREMNTKFLTTP